MTREGALARLADGEAAFRDVRAYLEAQDAPEAAPATGVAPPLDPPPTATPLLAWGGKVSQTFRDRVRLTGENFGFDPNWLMACMAFETMETFRTDIRPIRNGKRLSSAVGLIQFLDATAHELETTTDALAAMTPEKQFDFVWLYLRNRIKERGAIRSLEDCYMSIHWPAAMGKPLDYPMYVRDTPAFAANSSLDLNKDGVITKREAGKLIRDKLAKGLLAENMA